MPHVGADLWCGIADWNQARGPSPLGEGHGCGSFGATVDSCFIIYG
jgi:hypothetical protein